MEEQERPKPNYFMSYDVKRTRWILNVLDPVTETVVEKKEFINGMWKKVKE